MIVALVKRFVTRAVSPVPQNLNAVIYGEYKGHAVRLRPKLEDGRPWLVKEWVPDTDSCRMVDLELEEAASSKQPDAPAQLAQPEQKADSSVPEGFNPAACMGL